MTFTEILKRTRSLLSDPNYDQTLILNAANDFVNELFNNTRTRLMETSVALSGSAGDTAIPFGSDQVAWISVYLTSPDTYDLREYYTEYADFMANYSGFATATASKPYNWTQYGGSIRFSAPLLTDITIQMDYLRQPKAMTGTGSKCEVPDRYLELVAKGAKARVLEVDENYDEANAERDNLAPLVTTFIRNEARGGGKTGPIVMRSRRSGIRRR